MPNDTLITKADLTRKINQYITAGDLDGANKLADLLNKLYPDTPPKSSKPKSKVGKTKSVAEAPAKTSSKKKRGRPPGKTKREKLEESDDTILVEDGQTKQSQEKIKNKIRVVDRDGAIVNRTSTRQITRISSEASKKDAALAKKLLVHRENVPRVVEETDYPKCPNCDAQWTRANQIGFIFDEGKYRHKCHSCKLIHPPREQ